MTTFDGTWITTLGNFSLRVFRDDETDLDAQCDPPRIALTCRRQTAFLPFAARRNKESCATIRHGSNAYVDCIKTLRSITGGAECRVS